MVAILTKIGSEIAMVTQGLDLLYPAAFVHHSTMVQSGHWEKAIVPVPSSRTVMADIDVRQHRKVLKKEEDCGKQDQRKGIN